MGHLVGVGWAADLGAGDVPALRRLHRAAGLDGRRQKAARAAAILALVGSINLPIIHFSVEWWNSIHQGTSLFRKDGPSMPPVFWVPLLLMALAYMSAFGSLWLVGIRGELWRRRAEAAALRVARG